MRHCKRLFLVLSTVTLGCGPFEADPAPTAKLTQAFSSYRDQLYTFTFSGSLLTDVAYSPQDKITSQMYYTIGQLNGFKSVGRLDTMKVSDVIREAVPGSSLTKISYKIALEVAWGDTAKRPEDFVFKLPLDMSSSGLSNFVRKYNVQACLDWGAHEVSVDTHWYYYRPDQLQYGCKIDPADVVTMKPTVEKSPLNSNGKYPEYNEIWNDWAFKAVIVYGRDKAGSGNSMSDFGVTGFLSLNTMLRGSIAGGAMYLGPKLTYYRGDRPLEANRGVCTVDAGKAVCACNAGFHVDGAACAADASNPCNSNPCSEAGKTTCTVADGKAVCGCDAGYRLEAGACVVDSICTPNPCKEAKKSVCTVAEGQAVCGCDPGYVLDGARCVVDSASPCFVNPCLPDKIYPDVEYKGQAPDGRQVQINMLLIDNPQAYNPAFDKRYGELSTDADYIVYNGHAALGANVRAMTKKGKWKAGKYQILFMDGCDSFAYVDGYLAQERAKLNPDDPTGTKYLDIITNGLPANPTWFPQAMASIINNLYNIQRPVTYQQILREFDPGHYSVVTGDEDNVYNGEPILRPVVENCTNTLDDDGDTLADCADPDCAKDPVCAGPVWTGMEQSGTVAKDQESRYETPALAAGEYVFTITGTGDADLYVKAGAQPTTSSYDCRPYKNGSEENCVVTLTDKTVVYVMVRGWAASSTYTLKGMPSAKADMANLPDGPDRDGQASGCAVSAQPAKLSGTCLLLGALALLLARRRRG